MIHMFISYGIVPEAPLPVKAAVIIPHDGGIFNPASQNKSERLTDENHRLEFALVPIGAGGGNRIVDFSFFAFEYTTCCVFRSFLYNILCVVFHAFSCSYRVKGKIKGQNATI